MTVRLAATVAALLALGSHRAANADPVELTIIPVGLGADATIESEADPLAWRGGLRISCADDRFGGLSDLVVSEDGKRLIAVSDDGRWFTARLLYDEEGMLRGIEDGWMARLRGPDGKRLKGKAEGDAEALAVLEDDSTLVGFERDHRILRYPPGTPPQAGAPARFPSPPGIAQAPNNSGIEALAALSDGGVLALTEGQEADDGLAAYLWAENDWSSLTYKTDLDFKPTGVARLPNGDLMVLERRASLLGGFATRLRRISGQELRPGPVPPGVLRGTPLATLRPPFPLENYEGIAARADQDGGTLLYLLSDDDFNAFRETFLVMLVLED